MDLAFNLIDARAFYLDYSKLIEQIEQMLASFSFDFEKPPDFRGFFCRLCHHFSECEDIELISKIVTILANIASYKLGTLVYNIFDAPAPLLLTLLKRPIKERLQVVIDYFRKISRAIGPRLILQKFVGPNSSNNEVQRGLVILAHQLLVDNKEFAFNKEDFDDWIMNLSPVVGIGQILVKDVLEKCPEMGDLLGSRPPTSGQLYLSERSPPISRDSKKPKVPPNSAPPGGPRRIRTEPCLMYQLTPRQQQVREFVDEPFSTHEKMHDVIQQMISNVQSKDWEDRSTAFYTAKRVLRYHVNALSDDDLHTIVTTVLDDVGSTRVALALASVSVIEEAFLQKPAAMEFELARVLPVLIRLHEKRAQFFECAITKCTDIIVKTMPPKRFLDVIIANGESRSPKVQTAVAKVTRDSLQKCLSTDGRLFAKNTDEVGNLIKMINRLLSAGAADTRDLARECVRLLAQIYKDSFPSMVSRVLDARPASEFLHCV